MVQLLTNYSIGQILLFIVLAAIAFKEIASFLDWITAKAKVKVHKDEIPQNLAQKLEQAIQQREDQVAYLQDNQTQIEKAIHELNQKLNMLIASDRDDIKAWITAQHHHFTEKGSIDYYSFDCISKRYEHYKKQGGNTFIDDLMEDLIKLPKFGDKNKIHGI